MKIPMADGEQGTMQTLEAMKKIVLEDYCQPDIRTFVLREIVGNVAGHDSLGECDAIWRYARDRITYRQDPFGVERISDLWSTLYALNPREPEGDCGIKTLFIATCCAAIGHKPFFVVIKQRPNQRSFNHVYNMVIVDGVVRYYDATPQDEPAGYEADSWEKKLFEIF